MRERRRRCLRPFLCYNAGMRHRWIWLLPAAYFPYHVLIAARMMRSGWFGLMYENAAPPVVFSSLGVWIAGFCGAVAWCMLSKRSHDPAILQTKTLRLVKFAQIPAYLIFFQACFIFPFTIMTIPISRFYIPICLLAILLTGMCGAVAASSCRGEGLFSRKEAVLLALSQWIFVLDLLGMERMYGKARRAEKAARRAAREQAALQEETPEKT